MIWERERVVQRLTTAEIQSLQAIVARKLFRHIQKRIKPFSDPKVRNLKVDLSKEEYAASFGLYYINDLQRRYVEVDEILSITLLSDVFAPKGPQLMRVKLNTNLF